MASDAENLATIRSNILARLAEVTATKKPTYGEDGQNVDWNEYQRLLSDLSAVDSGISQAAAAVPFEIVSQGMT